jgi:acyl carrier protein
VVLVCELRAEALAGAAGAAARAALLAEVAARLRAVALREFGVALARVLVLAPHGVAKTTSGKVARQWNARAFAKFAEAEEAAVAAAGAGPVAAPAAWNGKEGVVLLAESGGAGAAASDEADAEAGDAEEMVAAVGPGGSGSGSGGAGEAAARPDLRAAEGAVLLLSLRRDVARHLGGGPLPATDAALAHLGLDSLTLAQLQARLEGEYGLRVADEAMFADETTLDWLVRFAPQLRGLAPWPAPGEAPPAAPAPASTAAAATAAAVELVGEVPAVGPLPPRSAPRGPRQPSVMEANCPCFLLCCG